MIQIEETKWNTIRQERKETRELLEKILSECVENAGPDDPRFYPPSINLVSEITSMLTKLC